MMRGCNRLVRGVVHAPSGRSVVLSRAAPTGGAITFSEVAIQTALILRLLKLRHRKSAITGDV